MNSPHPVDPVDPVRISPLPIQSSEETDKATQPIVTAWFAWVTRGNVGQDLQDLQDGERGKWKQEYRVIIA